MGIITSLLGIVCILYYIAGVRYAGYRVSGLWIWLAAGIGWMVWGVGDGNGLLPSGGVCVKIGIHRRVCAGDGSILRSIHRFLKFWHIAGNSRQRKGSWMLLFRGNSPRGVFCEWSAAKVTENPRIAAQNGIFAVSVHREACYWKRSVQ